MSVNLAFEDKGEYLHAVVTGENTAANVAMYFAQVLEESQTTNSSRVLIEERLDGPRLGTLDVYQIAKEASHSPTMAIEALAYVDVNGEGTLMQFAEDIAVNRGVNARVFDTVADAEAWLRRQ